MPKANKEDPIENYIIEISNSVKLDPQIFLNPPSKELN